MKKLILLILLVSLIGCMSKEEEMSVRQSSLKNLENQLPEGCKISYLGELFVTFNRGSTSPVIVTICENSQTIVNNYKVENGKVTTDYISIQLKKLHEQEKELSSKQQILNKLSSKERHLLGIE